MYPSCNSYAQLSIITWVLVATINISSAYQAPYIDIKGLPELSYYQPGDINVAFTFALSKAGENGQLCSNKSIAGSFAYAEAAR